MSRANKKKPTPLAGMVAAAGACAAANPPAKSEKRPYSAADDAMILRLRAAGHTVAEIDRATGRSNGSTCCRLRLLRLRAKAEGSPPPAATPEKPIHRLASGKPTSTAKNRACLSCGKTFYSFGPGNRLCAKCRCRASDVSPYALF